MQCPASPRHSYKTGSAAIPSSPINGRVTAKPWNIRKKNDAVADYEIPKTPYSPSGSKKFDCLNRDKASLKVRPATSTTPRPFGKVAVPTKTNGRTTTPKPKQRHSSNNDPKPSDYKEWSFGKEKKFVKPPTTPKNKKAAISIQRFARGWWARLKFRVALLEYKLKNKNKLTQQAMEQMREGVETKKKYERNKMEAEFKAKAEEEAKAFGSEQTVSEGKDLITRLRQENKKLRDKNEKIFKAAQGLKAQNERLEGVNTQTDGSMGILETHFKQIEDTHKKLSHVVPKYELSVSQLSNAAEQHRQYCVVEHNIKLMYVKLIGTIVEMLEKQGRQPELTDEIVGYVLAMEGKDNDQPLPVDSPQEDENVEIPPTKTSKETASSTNTLSKSRQNQLKHPYHVAQTHDDSDSDSEDYDEYSVATFD